MIITEILPDLFFIRRGFLNGNHLVYRSASPILIDTAYKTGSKTTLRALNRLGLDPSVISMIISTHCHCDHIGGNHLLQEISGCQVAMHETGGRFINRKEGRATWWDYYVQEAEFFDCNIFLNDGDELVIGPYEFTVIHTPGHSADGVVLYSSEHKLLISSDTVWENDMAVVTELVEGKQTLSWWMESLERIRTLDVRLVCPGHGDLFSEFKPAVQRTQKRIRSFIENPELIGRDVLKKIIVYTLMMKRGFLEADFLSFLLTTPWYRETVDHYFSEQYESMFESVMQELISKGVIVVKKGRILTSVRP